MDLSHAILNLLELLLQGNGRLGEKPETPALLAERKKGILEQLVDDCRDRLSKRRSVYCWMKKGSYVVGSDRQVLKDLQNGDRLRNIEMKRLPWEATLHLLHAVDDVRVAALDVAPQRVE